MGPKKARRQYKKLTGRLPNCAVYSGQLTLSTETQSEPPEQSLVKESAPLSKTAEQEDESLSLDLCDIDPRLRGGAEMSGALYTPSAAAEPPSRAPTVSLTPALQPTAPEPTAPEPTAPEHTAPEHTAPEPTAPEHTAPQPTAPIYQPACQSRSPVVSTQSNPSSSRTPAASRSRQRVRLTDEDD